MTAVVFSDVAAQRHYLDTSAEEAARRKGLVVVAPRPNELFIDIDDEAQMAVFRRNIEILRKHVPCEERVAPSPSGAPHFHITVSLGRGVVGAFERIMLQALLGSDLWHEMLSWRAATIGADEPSVFFERPGATP